MRLAFSFGFLLVAAGFLAACSEAVEPVSGGITGTIVPAGSAKEIYLINTADTLNPDTLKTFPTADGSFEMMDVKAGWYDLAVLADAGFDQPANQRIIITAGQTMQARAIKMERFGSNGQFSVTIDTKEYSSELTNIPGGSSNLTATANDFTFTLSLPKVTGPATFNSATNSNLKLGITSKNRSWMAHDSLGSMSLTVTSFDSVTKRGDAEFSFTAGSPTEKNLTGTKGRLQFVKFK